MIPSGITTLTQMIQKFHNDAICREYLEQKRWNGRPTCPHCGSVQAYKLKNGKAYKCANKQCTKKFTVTVGTILENSNIPLQTWFAAIYICTAHKKGISSIQLSKDLGITQKSAWFMMHRIREMIKDKKPTMLGGNGEPVEVDETYVKAGKPKEIPHPNAIKKGTQGRSTKDKAPVFGMIERNGKVVTVVVDNTKKATLKPIIEKMIPKSVLVISDEYKSYAYLSSNGYHHETVNHLQKEYARGDYHTNTIEGYWSLFKRGIFGIYHFVSVKHLQRYCDEFGYRYNTRSIKDYQRFEVTLQLLEGRLKYKDLIKK